MKKTSDRKKFRISIILLIILLLFSTAIVWYYFATIFSHVTALEFGVETLLLIGLGILIGKLFGMLGRMSK